MHVKKNKCMFYSNIKKFYLYDSWEAFPTLSFMTQHVPYLETQKVILFVPKVMKFLFCLNAKTMAHFSGTIQGNSKILLPMGPLGACLTPASVKSWGANFSYSWSPTYCINVGLVCPNKTFLLLEPIVPCLQ